MLLRGLLSIETLSNHLIHLVEEPTLVIGHELRYISRPRLLVIFFFYYFSFVSEST
jgi:hypothetical protein